MAELVTAIRDYEAWLYALLGLLVLRELATMWRSGRESDAAMFGLEREVASGKAMRSLVMLLLLVTIGAGIYTAAHVVAPALPQREQHLAEEEPIVEKPRGLTAPTDTASPPPATGTPRQPRIVTAPPAPSSPAAPVSEDLLCRNPNVDIVSPGSGAVLTAPSPIVVTVRFDAASGQTFRLEIGTGEAPQQWTALIEPHAEPVTAAVAQTLDAEALEPGIYTLRLTLAEPDGTVGEGNACAVTVRVP